MSAQLFPRARLLTALVVAAVVLPPLTGCGSESRDDNAVEAVEKNTVQLGAVRYRVVVFRELNVHTAPDDALWTGRPPAPGTGLYMAVVRACAGEGDGGRMTEQIHLEDAFGETFAPRSANTADRFEYSAERLEPEECSPRPGSAADRTFDGGPLVFRVPFESTAERPLILEIGDPRGSGTARIQLDL